MRGDNKMVRLTIAEIITIGEWLDDNIRSIDTDSHVIIHDDYITVMMNDEEQFYKIADIMAEY